MKSLVLILLLSFSVSALDGIDQTACEVDADCIAASCCHPSTAVNKRFAPKCADMMCTEECRAPFDCGCSEIVCVKKKCVMRVRDSMKEALLCKVR